ncbi:uncharacterized protein JNUCC1_03546 [Lentibacillus sp. JNUCC-1]|uniref:patatin-like phospholipase family protein n=1 Tax=Lentibacillus sp. JNUCC-1 TaxID=2654513 RepID=UPI00132793CF|nr:uncharacterized protein [Lentibacillus sp. JNUCC-1]
MRIDVVFSGGGVKAYAFMGTLNRLKEADLEPVRVAGTSAGAIIAGLVAAGYDNKSIQQMAFDIDLKEFLDAPPLTQYLPFTKWALLYFKMGLYRGVKLEKWLYDVLSEKGVYTFKDIPAGHLKMVVSDLSREKLIVIPDDLLTVYGIRPEEFSVATAIRMSAGFPYFFMPKKLMGTDHCESVIVDGGLLSNFPLWIFGNGKVKKLRPVLGVQLTDQDPPMTTISNATHMLRSFFTTMKEAHDTRYIDQSHVNNIIHIPVEHIEAVDMKVSKEVKQRLVDKGYQEADHFLKHWST